MMRRIVASLITVALAAGCAKPEAKKRDEMRNCSAISLDAPAITACLETQYHWNDVEAKTAGETQQHEMDSVAAFQRDSAWHADAVRHRAELRKCAAAAGDVGACLEDSYAWEPGRASAAFDSLWRTDASIHRLQIRRCAAQRKSSVGSCLMLYYKWDPKHALALTDSLERAKIAAQRH